jgi:hypothetical protein
MKNSVTACLIIFVFSICQNTIAQEIHLNMGFGFDIRRYYPESNFIVNNDISKLTPKFKFSLNSSYRRFIWKKAGLVAVGGVGLERTSFYFPIRAENDYASTLYDNINVNFYRTALSLGTHKTINLYKGNVQLNLGLNFNWILNLNNQFYKDSRGNDFSNMDISFDTLYPSTRPYEYKILIEQPRSLNSNIDLQLDLFFHLKRNLKFTCGIRIPFMGQFDEYTTNAQMLLRRISFFQPSDPNLPPVAGYWYYHKGVSDYGMYWFASINFGLLINLHNR